MEILVRFEMHADRILLFLEFLRAFDSDKECVRHTTGMDCIVIAAQIIVLTLGSRRAFGIDRHLVCARVIYRTACNADEERIGS